MASNLFKWKHYEESIILLTLRWYLKYPLSYRNLSEMMSERGLEIAHTTIMRWVHQYSPELDKRIRKHLNKTNDSWRVDETYIKIKGEWKYLYRAVDSNGDTIDFLLTAKRDKKAAMRFFKKALGSTHSSTPRAITIDKSGANLSAVKSLVSDKNSGFSPNTEIRQNKYLNNIIEQDHRAIKRITKPMMGFHSFHTANRTLKGIESMHMIKKGQVAEVKCVHSEIQFINRIFGISA